MNDTSRTAQKRYQELLSQRTPAERLGIAMSLSRAVRQLAVAGIRAAYPNASERQVTARLAERLYGTAVAVRLYGPISDVR